MNFKYLIRQDLNLVPPFKVISSNTSPNEASTPTVEASSFVENSTFLKVMVCIPIIGIFPGDICEHLLEKKLKKEVNSKNKITILNIQRDYKICALIRNLLSIALAVSVVALGIFSGFAVNIILGVVSFVAFNTGKNVYDIYKNRQAVNKLKAADSRVFDI